ncbi:MAG: hypothetical protein RBT11_18220 [Desulfobacterales bacterium]|nr:hypothetical protein [Desulfobacterales bacterium]
MRELPPLPVRFLIKKDCNHFLAAGNVQQFENHLWAKGYCVDTVGLDADMIRKFVRYQEKKEQQVEQLQLFD